MGFARRKSDNQSTWFSFHSSDESAEASRKDRGRTPLRAFVKIRAIISWWEVLIEREDQPVGSSFLQSYTGITETNGPLPMKNIEMLLNDAIKYLEKIVSNFVTIHNKYQINLVNDIKQLSVVRHIYETLLASIKSKHPLPRKEIIRKITNTLPTLRNIADKDPLVILGKPEYLRRRKVA